MFANSIGDFSQKLEFLAHLGIVVNFALMIFTSEKLYKFFQEYSYKYTVFEFFLIIVAVEHLL